MAYHRVLVVFGALLYTQASAFSATPPDTKQPADCGQCVIDFEAAGGCAAILANKDVEAMGLVPAGCDPCGAEAAVHCGIPSCPMARCAPCPPGTTSKPKNTPPDPETGCPALCDFECVREPTPVTGTVYTLTTTIAQQTPGNEYCPECFNAPAYYLSLAGYTGLPGLVLNIFPGEPQVCDGDNDCDGRRLQSAGSTVAVVTTTVPASNIPGQSQMNSLGQPATVANVTGTPVLQSTLTSAPAPSGGCSYTCSDNNNWDCISTFQTSVQNTNDVVDACNQCASSSSLPSTCRMCCDICCTPPPPPPPQPLVACAQYGFFCGEHGCDCDHSCGTPWDLTSILQADNLSPVPYPTDDPEHTQCRNRHFCTCTSDSPTDPDATCTCIQKQNGPPFAPVVCLRNKFIASCTAASPTGAMYKTDCSYTECS